jgi:hypothetical protein
MRVRECVTRPVRPQAEDEYMISDYDLFVTKFISVPKEMGHLNCAAYVAGIVRGVLEGAGFPARCAEQRSCSESCDTASHPAPPCCLPAACRVTAHSVPVKDQPRPKTTILIKFDASVLAREQRLPSS